LPQRAAPGGNIKILYIAGSGRSGTTILARLLGEVQGFVSVGEAARYLLDLNLQEKHLPCACGQPVPSCAFWKDLVPLVSPEQAATGTELVRMRRFPSLLRNSTQSSVAQQYRPILDAIAEVYRRILDRDGDHVVVDSSKNPSNALLLSLAPEVELHVLHVVRNPHDVVSSWTKKKGYLAVHPARKVIAWWWSYNLLSEALKRCAKTYRLLRYEDFVEHPGTSLADITADIMGSSLPLPFLSGSEATVHLQHVLGGNPDKMESGKIKIGPANKSSNGSKRLMVDLLTFPLQYRYHYLP